MLTTISASERMQELGYILPCYIETNYRDRPIEETVIELDCFGGESLSSSLEKVAYQFIRRGNIQSLPSYR